MQVICINDNWEPHPNAVTRSTPKFGDILTIVGTHKQWGCIFYIFLEYERDSIFRTDMFVEVNSPDEVEMAKEREQKAVDRAKNLQPAGVIALFIVLYLLS